MTYDEGTYTTLGDLIDKGYSAREVRFFLLQSHYRQPVRLTEERLQASRAALCRIDECVRNLYERQTDVCCVEEMDTWIVEMQDEFRKAILDDLNISAALAAMFRLIRQANYLMARGCLCKAHASAVLKAMRQVDGVLAILPPAPKPEELPDDVEQLVRDRHEARENGDFDRADGLREQLVEKGFSVEDRPEGPRIKRLP